MAGFVFALLLSVLLLLVWRLRRYQRLPPGPKGVPVLGNVFDLPPEGVPEHEHWLLHRDKYGPLSSVTLMGQTMILIHDRKVATDLLEKTSKKTSGRPHMEFALKVCGYENIVATRQMDLTFRKQRKLIHQQFGTAKQVARFDDIQRRCLLELLLKTLDNPSGLVEQLKTTIGAIILRSTYNYRAETNSVDPLIKLSQRVMKNFSTAAMPMTWIVDVFPSFQHLPHWFPGVKFKQFATQCKKMVDASADILFEFAQHDKSTQSSFDSYVARALRQCESTELSDEEDNTLTTKPDSDTVKWTAAALYGAGTDTTAATLESFVLAMSKFPHVQARAQQELDEVVGPSRLPELTDRENLPYINALVKEVYRWHPAVPLSLPRVTTDEVRYGGYVIPRGSFILPSLRWLCHDPETYKDPHLFDPERFLAPRSEMDPKTFVFGFRSRICLGRYFADSTVFQAVTLLLATFSVEQGLDENGKEHNSPVASTPGIIDFVKPFSYKVTPRLGPVRELIQAAYSDLEGDEGNDAALIRDQEIFRELID